MKLYVGNIPYKTTEVELRALFEKWEPLPDFFYPVDRETGRQRGFAFVTLQSKRDVEAAIEELKTLDTVKDLVIEGLESVLAPDQSSDASASADALRRLRSGFHLGGEPLTREEVHAR